MPKEATGSANAAKPFWKKLFQRLQTTPKPGAAEPLTSQPRIEEGDGRAIAARLRALLEDAESHGWNPQLGISVLCTCGAVGEIRYSRSALRHGQLEEGWELCFWKDGRGQYADFEEAEEGIVCPKCAGQRLSLRHSPVTIGDWLTAGFNAIEPCLKDVERGMRDDESGELFHDHGFAPVSTVDGVWKLIRYSVDPAALLVTDYKVDMLWTRSHRWRHVKRFSAIHIVNRKDNMYFDLFKDATGKYWVSKCFAQ